MWRTTPSTVILLSLQIHYLLIIANRKFIPIFVGKFNELCEMLHKSNDLLTSQLANLDTLLESFNLENYSMVILAILYVKLSSISSISQPVTLFSQLTDFAINANAQHIQLVPETCSYFQRSIFLVSSFFRLILFHSLQLRMFFIHIPKLLLK